MLKEWLRLAIAWRRIKQVDLAKQLSTSVGRSVDASAVHKMLRGDRRMFADELLHIASICKYPIPIKPQYGLVSEAELSAIDTLYRNTYDKERESLSTFQGQEIAKKLEISSDDLRRAIVLQLVHSNATLTNKTINEIADGIINTCRPESGY